MDSRLDENSIVLSVSEHEKEKKQHAQTEAKSVNLNNEKLISITDTFTHLKNTTYN